MIAVGDLLLLISLCDYTSCNGLSAVLRRDDDCESSLVSVPLTSVSSFIHSAVLGNAHSSLFL